MSSAADASGPNGFENFEELRRAVGWSMTPPPPVVHQQVLALFAEAHAIAPRRRRSIATRVDDRELLVVRSDSPGEHLVYSSDLADVVIEVDDQVIHGQVLPIVRPTPAAFAVTVIDGPTGARSYEGDENGAFSLPPLPAGDYRLLLDNTHLEIELDVRVDGNLL